MGTAGTLKARLNPLIERVGAGLFGVDQYADIFERLALAHGPAWLWRLLARRRLALEIAAAPLLFIHVPKNGGTSVKRALYKSDPGHASLRYYRLFFPSYLARAETFAIIREPTERFLSGYDFLMNGGGRDVRIQPGLMRRMRHVRTIDDFLDFLEAAHGNWLKVDTFARPQHWYVTDRAGVVRVRHLWLLEEAGERLPAFLADHGVPGLPHANRTQREQRALTAGQRGRLARLYAEDFLLYAALKARGGYSDALDGAPLSASSLRITSASTAS
ncbi:MAG: sulfotransferase family 2 domain-containing protein [Sphingobium sp.]|nr:sulfotransferase family 2 domain-containing protein [Sphingobium sp.]MBP6111564.1 sulfotransferase family 2 domain-containing protein [Sphingobium sp.]MBP8670507.1 sulfotransferase family 2 domain-containing protein [Sphingobium sp.]MCC6482555.1 sulfotransferase family 2 domain-containing protein [Sphingomonadaceae bacterium]